MSVIIVGDLYRGDLSPGEGKRGKRVGSIAMFGRARTSAMGIRTIVRDRLNLHLVHHSLSDLGVSRNPIS